MATLLSRQKPWPRAPVGVVTRRADRDEGGLGSVAEECLDRVQPAPGRDQRGLERLRRDRGVGVEIAAARSCESLDRGDIARIVDADDVGNGRRHRLGGDQLLLEVGVVDAAERRVDARGLFGVEAPVSWRSWPVDVTTRIRPAMPTA